MSLNKLLLAELKQEMPHTRITLSRVPFAENPTWKPHEKSMELGKLAKHLAHIPSWISITLTTDVLDFSKPSEPARNVQTTAELLQYFDENLDKGLDLLSNATDELLFGDWTMRNGETIYFTMPRIAVLRSFVISHNIHHRAQLGVYLRLLNLPVPAIYGSSADEGSM